LIYYLLNSKTSSTPQLALFEKDYVKQRAMDRAVDSLRKRFGNGSVFIFVYWIVGCASAVAGQLMTRDFWSCLVNC